MGNGKGKRYDEAFKREAVAMVVELKVPYTRAARELGVSEETLRRWILDAGQSTQQDSEKTDKQRIRELERENANLKMERDILKGAMVSSMGERNGLQ